jgi:predicted small secreted protein
MRPACSFRLRAEAPFVLAFALLLTACGATTRGANDDMTISTRVKIALLNDRQLGPLRIDARTFQGVVTLTGTVPSPTDEQRAIAVARTVRGVKDVKSEMKIDSRVRGFRGSAGSGVPRVPRVPRVPAFQVEVLVPCGCC